MKEISKIEYTAFIPEGEKPKDPKTAAMIGAPSGTIEKGIIDKTGLWKRYGYNGKFEKKLTKSKINQIFSSVQNVLEGNKTQPEYFNTAINVKEIIIFCNNETLKLNYDSNQEKYLKVKNILEKEISLVWKIW